MAQARIPLAALLLALATPLFAAPPAGRSFDNSLCDSICGARNFHVEESALKAKELFERARTEAAGVQPHQALDIEHYRLDIHLDPAARTIQGTVTLTFHPTAPLGQLRLRLHPALKMDGASLDGTGLSTVTRRGSNVTLAFAPGLLPASRHEIAVSYSGSPVTTSGLGGGMLFASHAGVPSATTLSEPFDSYAWWPCVDDVDDKATLDMILTVPSGMVGASNGTLQEVFNNPDGTQTYHWRESYPIANYLVSANVTNYAFFSDTYTALNGSTTMPVTYYVYPESLPSATGNVQAVPDMIRYFAELCGEYPFIDEKYGMVAFPWGGGMEHQTLTSMGDAFLGRSGNFEGIYAHELAHQWWGDEVTCGTWNDIWLNEGFATYFEVLWLARSNGLSESDVISQYDDGAYNGYLGGSVYVTDGNKPFADTGAIYDKGAWVLHMLRHVVGESAFWQGLADYRQAQGYGNATTDDLRHAFEAAYGRSLAWFFDQWVYTPKRPIYSLASSQSGSTLTVTLAQKQKHLVRRRSTHRDTYIMPVDLTLHYQDGSEETRSVWNDQRTQTFTLPVNQDVAAVGLDEDHWILKVVR